MSKIVPFINILAIALCVIDTRTGKHEASIPSTWVKKSWIEFHKLIG